jgi:hypothetical protein
MNKQQSNVTINHTAPAWPARSAGSWAAILTVSLASALSPGARAETISKNDFVFVNAVDSTQGFLLFGSAPAINNNGAVAFESVGFGFLFGSVWKWQDGALTLIATSAGDHLRNFGDNVVINASGTVGFNARIPNSSDAIIATGDGGALNIIASANEDGLIGGGFLGISALNDTGTAVFLGFRQGTFAQAIFIGNGGPLQTVVDAATEGFSALGNSDINASGKIVFRGFLPDGTVGIFVRARDISDVLDTNDPNVLDFLDPVMNDSGTVGIGAFLRSGGAQVLTTTGRTLTARTDPDRQSFLFVDNVCINNSGDVAFFGETLTGGGLFVELSGAADPVPVLETGDPLFGSTVVGLSNGRFSFNDRGEIVFHYALADGRSGIAVASRKSRADH